MRDLVPDKLRSIFSKPPGIHSETLVALANLKSSQCEKVGRIGRIQIQPQFLDREPFWNISHFLELRGMTSLDFTNRAADFDGRVDLVWCFCLWFRLVLLWRLAPGVRCEQERGDDTSDENELDAKNQFESVWLDSHLLLLARKGPTPGVIRAMDLPVAIGT